MKAACPFLGHLWTVVNERLWPLRTFKDIARAPQDLSLEMSLVLGPVAPFLSKRPSQDMLFWNVALVLGPVTPFYSTGVSQDMPFLCGHMHWDFYSHVSTFLFSTVNTMTLTSQTLTSNLLLSNLFRNLFILHLLLYCLSAEKIKMRINSKGLFSSSESKTNVVVWRSMFLLKQ